MIAMTRSISETVKFVASKLVQAMEHDGIHLIKTPLLMPGGGSIVIRIDGSRDRFFVSDYGVAYQEAELLGGARTFVRLAGPIAEKAGIFFDSHSFFYAEASYDQLPVVVTVVANAVKEALDLTALKMMEKRVADQKNKLIDKLSDVYSKAKYHVVPDAELIGASTHAWTCDALVETDGNRSRALVFDFVKNNHNRVFSVVTKFHDLARLDNAPKRTAVVSSTLNMKDYIGLLNQAGHVVELGAPSRAYERLVA